MKRRARVALLVQSATGYGRGMLRGIAAYIREAGPWAVFHRPGGLLQSIPEQLHAWRPEGIIAQLENPLFVRQVRRMKLPVVDLFGGLRSAGIPRLRDDNAAISRLVADFFLQRGYVHFAYCGPRGVFYCEQRRDAFVAHLAQAGYEVSVYETPAPAGIFGAFNLEAAGELDLPRIAAWIESLPKPVAVMASSDIRGQQVLSACSERGIAVPDELAVAGVGNDEVLCQLCDPLLTSVELNMERKGYEAAALLDRLMKGEKAPKDEILFEPVRMVSRGSTDSVAVTNCDLMSALRFIRDHYAEGISVQDIADHVALSRSTLQRRFATLLGRSPRDEIVQTQVQRVKDLLATSDLSLTRIAALAGFEHLESMCRLFKNRTGKTPGQFRKEARR
jgi:LacI family transcriptional regulator